MILWRDRKEEEEKYCPHAAFVQVLCVLILDLFSLPIRKGVPLPRLSIINAIFFPIGSPFLPKLSSAAADPLITQRFHLRFRRGATLCVTYPTR